jgi:hypothetical protein
MMQYGEIYLSRYSKNMQNNCLTLIFLFYREIDYQCISWLTSINQQKPPAQQNNHGNPSPIMRCQLFGHETYSSPCKEPILGMNMFLKYWL